MALTNMLTECISSKLQFQGLGHRRVEAEFNGGKITSDAGGWLLREVETRYGFIRGLAGCFEDRRDPGLTEHSVKELLRQRIYGLALGYEDSNDHDELRRDPWMAVRVGKRDPWGEDRGKACAGKSTLNRLELSSVSQNRYRKIPVDEAAGLEAGCLGRSRRRDGADRRATAGGLAKGPHRAASR